MSFLKLFLETTQETATTTSDFFDRLSYSIGNEDWKTEAAALQIQPHHRVISITGSGDRPLNLLTTSCKELISIDLNPLQNHLLRLKRAALEHLSFDEYLSFMGATDDRDRLARLQQLPLEEPTRQFWLKRPRMITKGILYQGVVERSLARASWLFRALRPGKVDALFAFDSIDEQRAFVKKHWDKPAVRRFLSIALKPSIIKRLVNDPCLYSNLDPTVNIATYIYDRCLLYLNTYLAKDSLILNLMMNKRVLPAAYPAYLREKEVNAIRKNLGCLSIVTEDLITYLESCPEASIDVFSLADVASYLDAESVVRLLKAVKRAARPGARFCMRQFLSNHTIPEELTSYFVREPDLEQRLTKEDSCIFYKFTTGTIRS